jgi:hypothetical protein
VAATHFGIIYATQSAIIRRYVYPINNSELTTALCGPGESIVSISNGPFPNSAAWLAAVNSAVTGAAGKPPGNPACCVVDNTSTVVHIIQADAAIDHLPNMTLVQAYATIPLGSTYDPGTGLFTAPGYTIPAYPGNGSDRPPANAVFVPPALIPKP